MGDLVKVLFNKVIFLAFPGFCVFPECEQMKGIFLNTKVKFLHSCHSNSSLNKCYLKTARTFMSINESQQLLERHYKLIQ